MGKTAVAGVLLAAMAFGAALAAQEAARFPWDHQGFAALADAAASARRSGRRLLLGLSGSPT